MEGMSSQLRWTYDLVCFSSIANLVLIICIVSMSLLLSISPFDCHPVTRGSVRRFSQVACICIVQAGSDHAIVLISSSVLPLHLHPRHSVKSLYPTKMSRPNLNPSHGVPASCRRIYRGVRVHASSTAISENSSPQGWQRSPSGTQPRMS